ncbi:sensor histidine kinase [Ignavigranum ruoffiae]|uniref:histidine kinase n=1 Tax=Ignavigranum ruoffiae TaxID=89093 RepID=A0A1H9H5T5_9LACT|nr:HAMP domain-containing sensor histidine kinase [Ignavigranum ruoffiae]UPQ85948.1 HAMP domain-containing histidine kinase [Ignavigranum ruoffiae]SEQ57711.1 histidine kinase [Ignavigranum ruoffiae]
MKNLKIFPKMFTQIFSILGIIIILVHLLVFFIFPKTYLETRKEKIHNMANEISSNMDGREIKYVEQTLDLYSKSSKIKAFIKENNNNNNELQIKDNINFNLESDSNSLIIEEREIKLNDGKKANIQFVSIADMQKEAKDLSLTFLPYSLLISILFSVIISLLYAKSIKNNIQEIKIVTDKMMKLDKKTRLKVNSNDEIGQLKHQINDLYSALLRTINDLEFKNKEIIKLEKLKYDFFKGASHELKTPLASLKIILENMKYNIGKYKERDIYINECIEIVDSITKNISQILSVHYIEKLSNDEEYLKINDTLEDVLKQYEILANQKKITVNIDLLDENVYIGKTALKMILSNLVSNAVKYTDVGGVIHIGKENSWLYIKNSNLNNKISNMDQLCDVKFDLNKENSNGLGLYIVSNILNNYNIEYKALQDEEFFIFKIKFFSD